MIPAAESLVDVAIRIISQHLPEESTYLKCGRTLLLDGIKNRGDNRVYSNISADILTGIVRSRLPLLDVLLEHVTQYIGDDRVLCSR